MATPMPSVPETVDERETVGTLDLQILRLDLWRLRQWTRTLSKT